MLLQFTAIFAAATALKILLIPAYHSTDFEVHRNWLAITYSLPLKQWYLDATSRWTLDYPPFFAYFEWVLSQLAQFVDNKMLILNNLDYASGQTKLFQRFSVITVDCIYALGVYRCLKAIIFKNDLYKHFVGATLLLLNIGLLFVDHIHFQYNGMLFGILLLSISCLLEQRYLLSALLFATLLNFKHIFLYMAPAFGVYFLKFYCLNADKNPLFCVMKLMICGLLPITLAFGPFWSQLPQVFARLFPFKRGLTHAYWAPNFWALYNVADKVLSYVFRVPRSIGDGPTTTSGLVKEFNHVFLPQITPKITFILTLLFMMPILMKLLLYTNRSDSKIVFLRSVVLCSCASFMFGWHVHEKALLMCLIPICLLCLLNAGDAKYAFLLSVPGYFQLFPLLFNVELFLVRYSLYLAYIIFMYDQLKRLHHNILTLNRIEWTYVYGFILLPIYEHFVSPFYGLNIKLPFMPLLLTSVYCSLGVTYFFISYYMYTLNFNNIFKSNPKKLSRKQSTTTAKSSSSASAAAKSTTKNSRNSIRVKQKTK